MTINELVAGVAVKSKSTGRVWMTCEYHNENYIFCRADDGERALLALEDLERTSYSSPNRMMLGSQ